MSPELDTALTFLANLAIFIIMFKIGDWGSRP